MNEYEFEELVQRALKKAGTGRALANLLGISDRTVSAWKLGGVKAPKDMRLVKMMEEYLG